MSSVRVGRFGMFTRNESCRAVPAETTIEVMSGANGSSPTASRYVTVASAWRVATAGADPDVPTPIPTVSMAGTTAQDPAKRLMNPGAALTARVYDGAEATASVPEKWRRRELTPRKVPISPRSRPV
jgi:hypothetical protein